MCCTVQYKHCIALDPDSKKMWLRRRKEWSLAQNVVGLYSGGPSPVRKSSNLSESLLILP